MADESSSFVDDAELLEEFREEALEHLDAVEPLVLAITESPAAQQLDLIHQAFRAVHSIKGVAGFLELELIERLSHAMESALMPIRDGKTSYPDALTDLWLSGIDSLRRMVEALPEREEPDISPLVESLREVAGAAATSAAKPTSEITTAPDPVEDAATAPDPVEDAVAAPLPKPVADPAIDSHAKTVRVHVDLLNDLMDLAGELVLARNQMVNRFSSEDPIASSILQGFDVLTTQLQSSIMRTRMQPLSIVVKKLPRIVRELARKLGKEVELVVEGADVELDKSILEALADPLTHLVRNALDHGVESPDQRVAGGKPRAATIRIVAIHDGGQVSIAVSDDGGGIDPDATREVAVRRRVLSQAEADALSRQAAKMLVFSPGFSTAARVTDVSGRGVGLDVVNANIARLGGKVEIDSEVGAGTTFYIRLPLTLAIIPSLIVRLGHERFAIPQANLVEIVHISEANRDELFHRVNGAPALKLRDCLVPLVALEEVLYPAREPCGADLEGGGRGRYAVLVRVGDNRFGLLVDGIDDSEEIVVKPLSSHLKSCRIFAGATIMSDGRVAMILDITAIAASNGIEARAASGAENDEAVRRDNDRLLVFACGSERFAVRLDQIARVEQLERSQLQRIGSREMTHTRTGIIELYRLGALRDQGELPDSVFVIVPKCEESGVGVLATALIDSVETAEQPAVGLHETEPASLGQQVIGEHITTRLDLARVCSSRARRGTDRSVA